MDPKFFRKYADLIAEAEQPEQQLNEGILGNVVQAVKGYFGKLIANDINKARAVASQVAGILGKSPDQLSIKDINLENVKKMIAASGVSTQNQQPQEGFVSEAWSTDQLKDAGKVTAFWTGLGGVFGALAAGNLVVRPFVYSTAAELVAGTAAANLAMLYGAAVFAIIFGLLAASIAIGDHEDPKEIEKRKAQKAQAMAQAEADRKARQKRFDDFFFPPK
jgi:hypothetical protein